MAEAQCITLDADSDDDSKRKKVSTGVKSSGFIRCNFCVEPGWLSVNDNPNKHRQLVHSSVLFYCDTCEDGEPGAEGFETFKEISKHVVEENGIDPTDKVNICELIRIPSKPDSLKLFRCTFCPGDGFKFVGLSDETFVNHVKNRHGQKALRSRPDKLKRECRVCGREYKTDHDLTKHITRRHLVKGKDNKFPFGGFGPRIKNGRKDSDDDQIGRIWGRVSGSEFVDEGPSGRRKTSTPLNAVVWGRRNSTGRKGMSAGREPEKSRNIVTLENPPRFEKKREARSRSSSLDGKRQIFGRKRTEKNRALSSSSCDEKDRKKAEKNVPSFSSNDDRKTFKRKKTTEKRRSSSSCSSDDERDRSERKRRKRRPSSSSSNGSEEDKMMKNRMEVKSWSPNDIRWLELTDQFLSKISKKRRSEQNEHGNRIFDEDLNRSNPKLPCCNFCGKFGIQDMPKHLSEIHQDKTFLCSLCEKPFADVDAAEDHLKHKHDRNGDGKSLIKTGLLQPPSCLLSVLCQFCSPPQRVVPSSSNTDNFMYEIYEHMDEHEDEHRGVEEEIRLATVYSCRICTGRIWKDFPSLADHVNKSHKNLEGREGPSVGQEVRRKESREWEGGGGRDDGKKFGKVQDGPSNRYNCGGELRRSLQSNRQENCAIKVCQSTASRVETLKGESSSRHRHITDLPQSKARAQYKSYPTKSSFRVGQYCLKKMEEIISEPTRIESASNLFQCLKCGVKIEDRYEMKKHLQNMHRLEGALPDLLDHFILPKNLIEARCNLCHRVWSDERDVRDKSVLRKHQNDFHKAAGTSFNSCFDFKCRVCPTNFSGNCLQEVTRHAENHSKGTNCSKKVDDTGLKREGGGLEERQKIANTPGRSDRGRNERTGGRDRLVRHSKEVKSGKSNSSTSPSPMEEHRQMIEKLMQMQVIVAGVVQDLLSNAVETGEFNLEKYKTMKSKNLEEVDRSSFSEPQNSQPLHSDSPLSPTANSPSSSPRPHCSTPTSPICEESSPLHLSPVKPDIDCIVLDTDLEMKSLIEEEEGNGTTSDLPLTGDTSNGELSTETNALKTENVAAVEISEVTEINESSDSSPVYLEEPLSVTEGDILNLDESSTDGQIIQTMEQLESLLSSGADFKLILAPELIETEAFKIFSMNNSLGLNADFSNQNEDTDDQVDQDNLDEGKGDYGD